jgi:hypothetical protein
MNVTLTIPEAIFEQNGGQIAHELLERAALEAFRAGAISLGRLAEILNLTIDEANGFLKASPSHLPTINGFNDEKEWLRLHRTPYRGQFVALAGKRLVAHGADEGEVIDRARDAGIPKPFVTYIETEAEESPLGSWLDE